MTKKQAVEFFFYGVGAIAGMETFRILIGSYIGERWYIYAIIALVSVFYASKIAQKLGGTS